MTKKLSAIIVLTAALFTGCTQTIPIHLHPENPHYFEWQNKPTVLITSGEHYGAVLNTDFNFEPYFQALHADGLNLTRTFSGIYCEHPEAFNISKNTLAPGEGKLLCPWARSDEPGYANGGNKFDLTQWDPAYFARLKNFVSVAKKYNIVVEFVLFCPFYGDEQWALSPVNAANNINSIGQVGRTQVFTLQDDDLTQVQDAMVRKIVAELNEFDNLYYEICNEPYFAGPTLEWQAHISQIITDTEAALPKQHLIAQNIANNTATITNPDPNVSLFNFHYAHPSAVDNNYHLNKALGDDETGFDGTENDAYRMEAWNFILAGGSLFDHLDYSFTTDTENGTYAFPETQPGGGGVEMRSQISTLKTFIENFDFIHLAPAQEIIAELPKGISARALGNDKEYAVYFSRKQQLKEYYSLRWTGQVAPKYSETYTFHTITDDGARLWVNGKKLIDDWTSHAAVKNTGSIQLKAGEKVNIRYEYFQGAGGAEAALLWSSLSQPKTEIGSEYFYLPDGKAPGLHLQWYDDVNLEKFKAEAVVFDASFDGSLEGIFPADATDDAVNTILAIPAGNYALDWINPTSGEIISSEKINHSGEKLAISAPAFDLDMALRIYK